MSISATSLGSLLSSCVASIAISSSFASQHMFFLFCSISLKVRWLQLLSVIQKPPRCHARGCHSWPTVGFSFVGSRDPLCSSQTQSARWPLALCISLSLSIQAVAYLPVEYSSGARNGDRYGKEAENVQRTWLCELFCFPFCFSDRPPKIFLPRRFYPEGTSLLASSSRPSENGCAHCVSSSQSV